MGQTKEQRIIKQLSNPASVQKRTAIASDMFLPNHSGDHSAGHTSTPTDDSDLANKKYVDDEIAGIPAPIVYLLRDGSNANSNINIGAYDLTTTGDLSGADGTFSGDLEFTSNPTINFGTGPVDRLSFQGQGIGQSVFYFKNSNWANSFILSLGAATAQFNTAQALNFITPSTISFQGSTSTTFQTPTATFTGDVYLDTDNKKLKFGQTNTDLQIYSDGRCLCRRRFNSNCWYSLSSQYYWF